MKNNRLFNCLGQLTVQDKQDTHEQLSSQVKSSQVTFI